MRFPQLRLTLRRLMAAIAFLAASLGFIRANSDSPARHFHCDLRVDFLPAGSPEGSGSLFTPRVGQARLSGLTSPAVLDAALTDAYLSTLPRIYNVAVPRDELRRMIDVQGDHDAGMAWMRIEGDLPVEPMLAADPLARAIESRGPPGARVTRSAGPLQMPLPPALLDRRWKVVATIAIMLLVTGTILFIPGKKTASKGDSNAPASGRGPTDLALRRAPGLGRCILVQSRRGLGGLVCRARSSDGENAEESMASPDDPYHLGRFLEAQEDDYAQALSEVTSGRKRSHWMWYIFPQLDGLAFSSTSKHYAIKSLDEARAYLDHPVLGPRLLEIAEAAVGLEDRSAREIFGSPDDLKLKSCATLFACVSPPGSVFERLLARYYQGQRDDRTLQLLGSRGNPGDAGTVRRGS